MFFFLFAATVLKIALEGTNKKIHSIIQFLTLVSDHSLKKVHKVKKRHPIFQTEVLDPYPHSNGRPQLRALVACLFLPFHIFCDFDVHIKLFLIYPAVVAEWLEQ